MKTVYKVFYKFLKTYNLTEQWLTTSRKIILLRGANYKVFVSGLLDNIDDKLFRKYFNKFQNKVSLIAFRRNIFKINLLNVYNYVLKHSGFEDNSAYNAEVIKINFDNNTFMNTSVFIQDPVNYLF